MDNSDIVCINCGKHQRDVNTIIAFPSQTRSQKHVYICNECIDSLHKIIHEEDKRNARDKSSK